MSEDGRASVQDLPVEVTVLAQGVVVLALRGEHDLATVEPLKSTVRDAVADGARVVVVDLAGAELVCSVTLAALLWSREHVRRAGGRFVLCGPFEGAAKVVQLSGLDCVFECAPARSQ